MKKQIVGMVGWAVVSFCAINLAFASASMQKCGNSTCPAGWESHNNSVCVRNGPASVMRKDPSAGCPGGWMRFCDTYCYKNK